jgi:hypothetical protein
VIDERDPSVDGNERLTALASAALLVFLLTELASTPRLNALLPAHIFVGVLIAGPLTLKLASVGYRFVRYYLGADAFVRKGPPRLVLRLMAPLLVATTLVLMATGIALVVTGPDDPGPFVGLHNLTFVLWLPLFAIHLFAYVRRVPHVVSADLGGRETEAVPGRIARVDLSAGSIVFGAIAAIVVLPIAAPWGAPGVLGQALPGPVVAGAVVTGVALVVTRPLRWTYH